MEGFQGIKDRVSVQRDRANSVLMDIATQGKEHVQQPQVPAQETNETETKTPENENQAVQQEEEKSTEEEKHAAGQEQVQENEEKEVKGPESTTEQKPETKEEKEEDWFSLTSQFESGTTEAPQSNINFEKLSNDLGIEVKSEADIVAGYKKLQENPIEGIPNIPQSLREAIGLSQKGGDWESFLKITNVDYNGFSNKELVYYDLVQNDYFKDEKGELNQEALADYMDVMSEAQINIEGNKLRKQLQAQQKHDLDNIQNAADTQKKANDVALKKVLDDKDFEINSWKPKARDRAMAWNEIRSGNWKAPFSNEDGSPNFSNILKVHLFLKYQKDIINNVAENASTKTKKEIYNEEQNVEITRNAQPPNPTPKKVSGIDKMIAHAKQLSGFAQ